jgi:ABC-type glutathione transport system ATPase component
MNADSVILSVRSVSSSYESHGPGLLGKKTVTPVLRDIDLEMREGETLGLAGESGCGKTTLARCILGLKSFRGEITVCGSRQDGRRSLPMARNLAAVFQSPGGALNPMMRVGRLLEEPLRVHGEGSAAGRERRAAEMLRLVGLDPAYKRRRVTELSAGQKQRVSIGCALMLRPRLLIADEAVSALDVSTGAQILNLFRSLRETLGLSLLFISHDLDVLDYLCDRTAVMRSGRVSFQEVENG